MTYFFSFFFLPPVASSTKIKSIVYQQKEKRRKKRNKKICTITNILMLKHFDTIPVNALNTDISCQSRSQNQFSITAANSVLIISRQLFLNKNVCSFSNLTLPLPIPLPRTPYAVQRLKYSRCET